MWVARQIRSALFLPMPGTRASSATEAHITAAGEPKCSSSCRARRGPTPGSPYAAYAKDSALDPTALGEVLQRVIDTAK